MMSLIRDVLMPAAPALALIVALVIPPRADAQARPTDATGARASAAVLAAQVIPSGGALRADDGLRAVGTEEVAAGTGDARRCRRIERIGKTTMRRCE